MPPITTQVNAKALNYEKIDGEKFGGVNAAIHDLPKMNEPTIIFGADVTHPSPGAGNFEPSIAAVVCSIDGYACRRDTFIVSSCYEWPAAAAAAAGFIRGAE